MFYYILVLVLCFFLQFLGFNKTKNGQKKFVIIIFGLLTLLACLRAYTVGVDTFQYYRNYINIGQNLFLNYTSRYEKGFYYLCKILYSFNSNPQFLIFLTSIFIIPVVGRFIYKNSEDVFLSTYFYITLGLYFFNLTGMRQSLALAICLIAYEFLKEKRSIIYVFLVFFASLFHTSALLFFVFLVLDKFRYSKNFYLLTILISFFSFAFGKSIIFFLLNFVERYAGYISTDFVVSNYFGAFFQFLLYLFIYTICHYIYVRTLNNDNKEDNNSFYMKCLSLCVIFSALTTQVNIIGRFTPYLSIFIIILLANLKNKIFNPKSRLLYIVAFITLLLFYFGIIEIFRPEWNGVQPYRFFWELIFN